MKIIHHIHHLALYIYIYIYEGHLESSYFGIITPQCLDKMLSNITFLGTRIQGLLGGFNFCRKRAWRACAAHAQTE